MYEQAVPFKAHGSVNLCTFSLIHPAHHPLPSSTQRFHLNTIPLPHLPQTNPARHLDGPPRRPERVPRGCGIRTGPSRLLLLSRGIRTGPSRLLCNSLGVTRTALSRHPDTGQPPSRHLLERQVVDVSQRVADRVAHVLDVTAQQRHQQPVQRGRVRTVADARLRRRAVRGAEGRGSQTGQRHGEWCGWWVNGELWKRAEWGGTRGC